MIPWWASGLVALVCAMAGYWQGHWHGRRFELEEMLRLLAASIIEPTER